jgi:hypothetical protein
MSSGWRGPIPAPLGLHRVHLPYTISLFHNTLNPTVHFNGSNGTAYTRPSMVQNNSNPEKQLVFLNKAVSIIMPVSFFELFSLQPLPSHKIVPLEPLALINTRFKKTSCRLSCKFTLLVNLSEGSFRESTGHPKYTLTQ